MRVGGQRHAPAALHPVPIIQEAGCAPWPVWTGAVNLAPPPPGFDPSTVQLYRLCYSSAESETETSFSQDTSLFPDSIVPATLQTRLPKNPAFTRNTGEV